jgi:hypothetical protein
MTYLAQICSHRESLLLIDVDVIDATADAEFVVQDDGPLGASWVSTPPVQTLEKKTRWTHICSLDITTNLQATEEALHWHLQFGLIARNFTVDVT